MQMRACQQWVISGALALSGLMGCASQAPVVAPASPSRTSADSPAAGMAPPRAARRVRFALVAAQSEETTEAARGIAAEELAQAGYWITDEKSSSDAILEVRVTRATNPVSASEGCATPGRQVSLALVRGDQPLDWFAMPIQCDAGDDGARSAIRGLIRELSASSRLQELADATARRPPPSAPSEQTILDERTRDDLAWNPSALRRCRNTHTQIACKTIIAYLAEFPSGAHSADARAVLRQVSQ
jgi:hypothetical protein